MKHPDPILPPPGRDESVDALGEAPADSLPELEASFEAALAEVDAIVAWSDPQGWSHGDLTQVIAVDDGLDDDEEPPTVRSPSGIRLSVEAGRPVARLEEEQVSSARVVDDYDDDEDERSDTDDEAADSNVA